MALVASLATAVSAFAGPGPTGNNFTTTPDTAPLGYTAANGYSSATANDGTDGLGVPNGAIKHVWVIVMENHAYEANFTGLNDNPYLSKTLPAAGAELTNYYGTGHSSLDNYLSLVSGQAPVTDDQADCPAYTALSGSVDTSGGSLASDGNYGQFASTAGADAPAGDNGCVYPSSVPTLMNQLDAEGISWKEYAQDLAVNPGTYNGGSHNGDTITGQDAGVSACGAPDSTVGATPSSSQSSNPGAYGSSSYVVGGASANDTDQYVAKHNPMGWFSSILGTPSKTDCNSSHIANLMDGSSDQLYSDLQSESSTPALSIISPNNCSDGHDAYCYGNNLSGMAAGAPTNASQGTPTNSVGGSYSSDLFLSHVVPEIMKSPAYADGGLISIVWDESYPQFTYSSDSFANSAVSSATAYNSLQIDSAGETLFGKSLNWEPSGPNVPNIVSQAGQQMSSGPGYNQYLHRPGSAATSPLEPCTTGTSSNGYSTIASGQCYSGGATSGPQASKSASNSTPNPFTNISVTASGMVTENGLSAGSLVSQNDEGDAVTLSGGYTTSSTAYIGQVSSAAPAAVTNGTGVTTSANDNYSSVSFQLVDSSGNNVTVSGGSLPASGLTLSIPAQTTENDPFYDAFDATTGGGDSGAIMISPYIKGGTVSNTYYNHYSLLRTLEDIFQTTNATGSSAGYTGSISLAKGVDGAGHIGYAAQAGLAPLGTDVFTASPFSTTTVTQTTPVTVTQTNTVVQTKTKTKIEKEKLTFVPYIVGETLNEGKKLLQHAGLKIAKVKGPNPKNGYTEYVSAVSPGQGKSELLGHSVTIAVKLKKNKK